MVSDVNDLSVEYKEDGHVVVKELDKAILSKGAWATVVFKYQDWDKRKEDYGPVKYSIRRFQKTGGEFKAKSKFNISSDDQAKKLIDVLQNWIEVAS